MPNGRTPDTGTSFYMFQDKDTPVADTSLEYAIRMCIASGIRPSRIQYFNNLISNIPNYNLINNLYGTKGGVPTNMGQMRGFPKPTISMNWEKIETTSIEYFGGHPNKIHTYEELWCRPAFNNIIGFAMDITIDVYSQTGATIPPDTGTPDTAVFTMGIGSSYPTSTTGTAEFSGSGASRKWRLTTLDPFTEEDQVSFLANGTTDYAAYWNGTDSAYQGTLSYSFNQIYLEAYYDTSSGSACTSVQTGSQKTLYYDPPSGTALVVGSEVWSDTGLTTNLAAGNYVYDVGYDGLGSYKYITMNSSGTVSSQGECAGGGL